MFKIEDLTRKDTTWSFYMLSLDDCTFAETELDEDLFKVTYTPTCTKHYDPFAFKFGSGVGALAHCQSEFLSFRYPPIYFGDFQSHPT